MSYLTYSQYALSDRTTHDHIDALYCITRETSLAKERKAGAVDARAKYHHFRPS